MSVRGKRRAREADLGFAVLDLERAERCGQPEAIFGWGKTPEQVAAIAVRLREDGRPVLATRVGRGHYEAVAQRVKGAVFHEAARCVTVGVAAAPRGRERVGIVSAGTSDLPVAEEARVSLAFFGWRAAMVTDVGVAGLHRLLARVEGLRRLDVLVVVAGMEGALPSVVAGLVACPVVAVPASVGYGVGAGGWAALAGMLTSCAAGVVVTNIDNGFGAAAAVARILAGTR